MAKKASAHFDNVAHRYDKAVAGYEWDGCAWLARELAQAVSASFGVSDSVVHSSVLPHAFRMLDHGSGTGILSEKLQSVFPNGHVIGIDVSFNMMAMHKLKNDKARCVLFDGASFPFLPGTFDLVASAGVLEFIQDEYSALRPLVSVAKQGGLIGVTCLSRIQYGGIQGAYAVLRERFSRVPFYSHPAGRLQEAFQKLNCRVQTQKEKCALVYPNGNIFYYGTLIARKESGCTAVLS